MEDTFGTEHASLSTKDFPTVVVKENGELGDEERAELLDLFQALLDTNEPHAYILDLTDAANLSESQRIYIAETLQMRGDDIANLWISVAVLVSSSSPDPKLELLDFWQKVTPVPSQSFTNMMSAVIWTRQTLEKRIKPPQISDAPPSEETRVDEAPVEKVRTRLSNPPPRRLRPPRRKKQEGEAWYKARATKLALLGAAIGGAALFLASPSRDAQRFTASKATFAMHVYKKASRGDVAVRDGAPCTEKDALRLEADMPTTAHVLLLMVDPAGRTTVALPADGTTSVGPLAEGKGVRLPASLKLDEANGRYWLHLLFCPSKIAVKDCKIATQGAVIEYPKGCVIQSLHINKMSL